LLKNGRRRAVRTVKGLALSADMPGMTARYLRKHLELGNVGVLGADSTLDMLRDDLALRLFNLDNLVKLGEREVPTAFIFLMPLTALNVAVRCGVLGSATRKNLLKIAFATFHFMMGRYLRKGGLGKGLMENLSKDMRSALWSEMMCLRSCNLCVALYTMIRDWEEGIEKGRNEPLGLNRGGSHSVECTFGMIRTQMWNDARIDALERAVINMTVLEDCMKELDMDPITERTTNTGGCVLTKIEGIEVPGFDRKMLENMNLLIHMKRKNWKTPPVQEAYRALVKYFTTMQEMLRAANYRDKFDLSSETSALGIQRFWVKKWDDSKFDHDVQPPTSFECDEDPEW
jgi:hypothetical protein